MNKVSLDKISDRASLLLSIQLKGQINTLSEELFRIDLVPMPGGYDLHISHENLLTLEFGSFSKPSQRIVTRAIQSIKRQ